MAVLVADGEVRLTGTVGAYFWEDGFTAADVAAALAQVGRDKDVTVVINSGGGIATEGAAIHALLAGHKGKVTGRVEGLAASAASLAILGADEVEMALGATFMIHEASTIAWGDAEEMRKAFEMLDTISNSFADVYAEETGKPVADIRAMMKAETWMSAQEAVDNGFADRITERVTKGVVEPAAFAYGVYAKAPDSLRTLAQAKGWTPATAKVKAETKPEEKPQSPPPAPAATIDPAVAAKIAEICADAGHPRMAAQLIREGATEATAKARMDTVRTVHQAVADARRLNPAAVPADFAETLLRDGVTAVAAKARCMDLVTAANGPEINSNLPPESGGTAVHPGLDPQAIYAKRAKGRRG